MNQNEARGYVFPILFPLDLMFLFSLGAFLWLGSTTAARMMGWYSHIESLLIVLPATFMLLDFTEDLLLARFLLAPSSITDGGSAIAKMITKAKSLVAGAAIFQTIFISAAGLALSCWSQPGCN
jgi:hypothetical protein